MSKDKRPKTGAPKDKEVTSQIEDLTKKVKELEENWKRALADYQNLEKRVAAERESRTLAASANLLRKILAVFDDLERASTHIKDEGMILALKKFDQLLREEGVEEILVLGKDFEGETAAAVEMVPGEKGKVVEVLERGYRYRGQVLRPAKVKVGQGPPD